MEHISLSSVHLYWNYKEKEEKEEEEEEEESGYGGSSGGDEAPTRFLVQCSRDGTGFLAASNLLADRQYRFDLLCQSATYQFRVLAVRDGVFSPPSQPSYSFMNGVTGMYNAVWQVKEMVS